MMITCDGSTGEGGGQSVRVALALAAVLGMNVRVINIRANRRVGGLRAQHVAGALAVAEVCGASLSGCRLGSCSVQMNISRDDTVSETTSLGRPIDIVVETAGAVTLVLQAALPVALRWRGIGSFVIRGGGTIVEMAPFTDYYTEVFGRIVEHFGVSMRCNVIKHGFWPRGGASVECTFALSQEHCHSTDKQAYLKPVDFTTRGTAVRVIGKAIVAGTVPPQVAGRIAASAAKKLRLRFRKEEAFEGDITIEPKVLKARDAIGNVAAALLIAEMSTGLVLGASEIGKRGVSSETVGTRAAERLCDALDAGGAVDKYMADQLVIFMAMAKGESRVLIGEPSLHLQTVANIAEVFGVEARIERIERSSAHILTVRGKGIPLPVLRR